MGQKSKFLTISVIVVNYNSSPFIKDCIDSLLRYTNPHRDEIIVVDNNSTDNSRDIIEKYRKVKLIKLKNNIGYGAGCNAGARIAKGDILLCMNPDVQLLTPLNSIRDIFMKNNTCAIVAPVVVSNNKMYSPIWKLPTVFGEFLGDFKIFSRRYHLIDTTKNNATIRLRTNQFASGAALFIKKTYFDQIGGFDENFFLYFEDADLFVRIYQLMYLCFLDTKTHVTHSNGESSTNLGDKKIMYHYQSEHYYFKKRDSKFSFQVHRVMIITTLLLKIIFNFIQNTIDKNSSNKIKAYSHSLKYYLSAD